MTGGGRIAPIKTTERLLPHDLFDSNAPPCASLCFRTVP